jgi:hypothetical protein
MSGAEAVERLSPEQRDALATAVTGLYKAAGIDLVRQEIEAQLPSPTPLFDIRQNELMIWPESDPAAPVRYDLDGEPAQNGSNGSSALPQLDISRLLFRQIPLSWDAWVKAWEMLASGGTGIRDQGSGIRDWGLGIGRQEWSLGAADRAPNP